MLAVDEQGIAEQLVAQAREKGIQLVGLERAAVAADEAGVGDRAGGRDE